MLWLFCFLARVNFRPPKRIPLLITAAIIGFLLLLRILNPDLIDRIERVTYDWRVRLALPFRPSTADNLGFVFIDEASIQAVHDGAFGYHYGLYWPRQVYGRVVQELARQGAKTIAFDVVFGELRPDHPFVQPPGGGMMESDDFLADQMQQAGNVILAVTPELEVPDLFRTNAAAIGDISTEKDSDGILRRVRAFRTYRHWHPLFLKVQADPEMGVDLRQAKVEKDKIILPRANGDSIVVPLDADGKFQLADFVGENLPPGWPERARPFRDERVWHMGIVIAAQELKLDLNRTKVDLPRGRIVLRGAGGVERALPVDPQGFLWIDWTIPPNDPQLFRQPISALLAESRDQWEGKTAAAPDDWRGKIAIIGSAVAGGNDLTDHGATPLRPDTLLVSKHWNVANSIITNRFIHRLSVGGELGLIILLGALSGLVAARLRTVPAALSVASLLVVFIALTVVAYIAWRIWLPMLLPVAALLATWAGLTAWRAVFEQSERRRVKSVFSRIVSPNVVHELLEAKQLSLGGARREVTVFFADVRGFTEFTDVSQEAAEAYVRDHGLRGAEASAHIDAQAREALNTVNLYLARVADTVKQHDGTLDKYIGDCVMAFWGAPTPNNRHAVTCVRAAIDAQRAIHELNAARAVENRRIEAANREREQEGRPGLPLLPLLSLGTGINTGLAAVGLMGSDAHILNYTVFGRDVNLASRLEGVSGRGRIIISEATFQHLQRDEPALAATCLPLAAVEVKGIRNAVRIYEVPWQPTPPV